MREREFRLITLPADDVAVDINTMLGMTLAVSPQSLIELVKLHPQSPPSYNAKVKAFILDQGMKLNVSKSSLSG